MSQDKTVGKVIGTTVGYGIDATIKLGGNIAAWTYEKARHIKVRFDSRKTVNVDPEVKECIVELPGTGKVRYTKDDVMVILAKIDKGEELNKLQKLIFKAMLSKA